MLTDTSTPAIDNARAHLDGCEVRLADAARVRKEAHRVLAALPPVEAGRAARIKLAVLTAEAAVEEADARWQECLTVHAVARGMWETLIRRAFVDREVSATRVALATARALTADLAARRADRQAVAQQLGCADSGAHPHANALAFVEALERHLRQLDPPRPAPNSPPGAHGRRVL